MINHAPWQITLTREASVEDAAKIECRLIVAVFAKILGRSFASKMLAKNLPAVELRADILVPVIAASYRQEAYFLLLLC